ncbi:MAG TPA: hypothetical protein VFP85_00170 [Vicinamibacterales bacterium]|nr:hypothetical protein [Vicinamibacterales bacterium]
MKRRDFVGRVTLGAAAAACTTLGKASPAAAQSGRVTLRFIGMMGFVERSDRSFLVATPGATHHHIVHVPFLMARAGSRAARTFAMTPAAGVIPAAFDTQLVGTRPADFVYRSLANTAIDVVSGTDDAVANAASQMAHLAQIAPGKRVRGNLEKWASATTSLRGGRIENSSAHPDAGKEWSFGGYRQPLTDAVNYSNRDGQATTVRLTSATDAATLTVEAGEATELWIISAADPGDRQNDPTRLVHSELLFDYLVDARPVLAECAEATGREVPPTALPFVRPTSASAGIVAGSTIPPLTDFCYVADILLRPFGKK